MKKIKTAISFCSIFLLFACTTDDLDENVEKQSIKNDLTTKLQYINLEELKKDKSSFLQFQKIEQDLNTLRKSKINNNEQFDFFIGNEKILFVEDKQFKIFTFPLHKSGDDQILENLVLKIDKEGISQSYLLKYDLTDSEKTKIKNGEVLDLQNKTEVFPLSDLINNINSKNGSTSKNIMQFLSTCYELQAYKKTELNNDVSIVYQYVQVDCINYFDMPWDPSYALINPNQVAAINTNISTYIQYGIPFPLRDYPYLLGNNFSSYPVLDDPIEENNINARNFFDNLTINERKWVLINASLYTSLLQKLNEKYWDQLYVQFAQNVIWQMTKNHICNFTRLTSEIETDLFYQAMAGAKIISVGEVCPDEFL